MQFDFNWNLYTKNTELKTAQTGGTLGEAHFSIPSTPTDKVPLKMSSQYKIAKHTRKQSTIKQTPTSLTENFRKYNYQKIVKYIKND